MDNHPIPQDVTNFQFRLIGDMTLKQFAYLASGCALAVVTLTLPTFFFVKLLIAICLAMSGVTLAFIPFEGRPFDVILIHFFKAVFSPNQYMYQKDQSPTQPAQKTYVASSVQTTQIANKPKEDKNKTILMQSVTPITPIVHMEEKKEKPIPQAPTPVVQAKDQAITKQTITLQSEISEAKEEEKKEKAGTQEAQKAHEKVLELENSLREAMLQKETLEKQLLTLQQSINSSKVPVYTPSAAQTQPVQPPTQQTSHVRTIPKQMGASLGLPLSPDFPNLITGIVKDPRGNVLPNMLIEVKDKDGNPVRAFKTNNLGQFASATPLLNGSYTILFEDPSGKNSFDAIEITAKGDILLPIEVTSVDQREKLRQELFT